MKVLFDSQIFDLQRYGGISKSFVEYFSHFPDSIDGTVAVLETDNSYLQELGWPYMGYALDHFITNKHFFLKRKLFRLYNRIIGGTFYVTGPECNIDYCKRIISKGDFDVFHPTYFDSYFLRYLNNKPFVLTIHDMIPEKYPQYFSSDDMQIQGKRLLAPLASKIIAVSEHTKRDIIEILGVPEEKIDVVYHAHSHMPYAKMERPFVFPYILYVGKRNYYKKFLWMCGQLLPFLMSNKEIHVVCTGYAFEEHEVDCLEKHQVMDRFHVVLASEDMMKALYQHALFFIFPSEYEGFGMPILEAYASGCPVVLSRSSCFPEVAGDAAIYFDADGEESNLSEIAQAVLNMSETERKNLVIKQNERLLKFSWESSINDLGKVYNSVVG